MFDFSLESLAKEKDSVSCNTFSGSTLKEDKKLLDRLVALWGQLDKVELGFDKASGLSYPRDNWGPKQWTERLMGCPEIAVIKDGETVVGFAMVRNTGDNDDYYISSVVIDGAYRGKGFGERLMEYIVENRPGQIAWLNVNLHNTAALALYKSLGFQPFTQNMFRKGDGVKKK